MQFNVRSRRAAARPLQRALILCVLAPFPCQLLYFKKKKNEKKERKKKASKQASWRCCLSRLELRAALPAAAERRAPSPHSHAEHGSPASRVRAERLPAPADPGCQVLTHSAFNHSLMDGILCIKMWPRHTAEGRTRGKADRRTHTYTQARRRKE